MSTNGTLTQSTKPLETDLQELADFARSRGDDSNAERLAELLAKLRTQTFNLVVFGEFKRGKTTFINALLGQPLLPAAVVPLTSVVTILHYGPQTQVEVEFLDGRRTLITPESLPEYVTERGNPTNAKGVRVVRVAVPSPLLRNGLQIVDTPGVGSVYEHNTEATREFLSQVDGAILLVASDPPISRGECEFLREIRPHVARLFVVQNKIDQLRPLEVVESLEFTEEVLGDMLGQGEVEVFPLSAREALEAQLTGDSDRLADSGLPRFVDELRRFQQQEQAQTLVVSVVRNALEVAEDERLGLDLERQAMTMTLEEIERRSAEFHRRRQELLAQQEDDAVLIRAAARKLIARTLQQDYHRERKSRAPQLRERAAHWAEQRRDAPASELLLEGNLFIHETLYEVVGQWRHEEEKRLEQELSAIFERFTQRANQSLSAIYSLARDVFELPPRPVETVPYLRAPSRFLWLDWQWEARPGLVGSKLAGWIPGARARAVQSIAERLLEEHDKACGRLRHDFAERAQAAFDEHARSVARGLSEAIAGIDRAIERAIAQKQRTTEQVEETESRVLAQTAELQRLTESLRAALPAEPVHV